MSRSDNIIRLYKMGNSLQKIGDVYNLSRERVRQILRKAGVSRTEGGQAILSSKKAYEKNKIRDERYLAKWGMSYDDYWFINNQNIPYIERPIRKYIEQKRNALKRGIGFNMTFSEWWEIWKNSGKWTDRGKGKEKYVMARYSDSGDYEVNNVKIIPSVENNSESWHHKTWNTRPSIECQ